MKKYSHPDNFLKESYEDYKINLKEIKQDEGKPLSFKKYKKINSLFGKMLQDYVLMGREVGLPGGIGTIIATKHDRKNKYRHVFAYDSNNGISSDETIMLDKYRYTIKFRRNGSIYRPITGFRFYPAWKFNERLKEIIKDGHGGRFTYLKSKTLHRDEI